MSTSAQLQDPATAQDSSTATELIAWAISTYGPRLVITTSFQAEGMAIIDIAARVSRDVRVSTLDTGRLPQETYEMIESVRHRYGIRVDVVSPDAHELETMVSRHGPNLFYESTAQRALCCEIRKVRPLERALANYEAWITGLRREQSASRASVAKVERVNGRTKISPLADWTREQLVAYLKDNDVPMHPLYSRGYTSIGCGPCTRATAAGEDERAGRWWWEQGNAGECGLHFRPDGSVERTVDVLLREVLEAAHGGRRGA